MPYVTPLRPDEPRRIGRYRLTGRADDPAAADAGALGVFAAKRVDGASVVVTVLADVGAADAAARDRFIAEARAARRVPPFCTARILDSGIEGTLPYLVTESVPGPSLAEVVQDEGPLTSGAVQALAAGCATGLAAIHQSGLVHGHLRPEVVILSPDGPRVVQFSITPPYGAATPAADMLAWARTVLFAAVGHPRASPRDLAALPDGLRALVTTCLSPDPAGRPPARAVLSDLLSRHDLSAGLLAEGSRSAESAARMPTGQGQRRVREPPPRGGRSRVALWAGACAACLLAIAAAITFISQRHPAPAATFSATPVPSTTSSARQARVQQDVPAQFAGNWSGDVHQTNPTLTVTVNISLTAGSPGGTVAYPALSCTGSLTVVSAGPGRLALHQVLQLTGSGHTSCVNGLVTLTRRPDGKLTYTFARPGGGSPTGTLATHH